MRGFRTVVVAAFAVLWTSGAANATTATTYDNVPNGQASFDNAVTSAGGAVRTQVLDRGVASYADFTISRAPNNTYSEITGALTDISPSGTVRGPNGDSRGSGITLTFNTAINSFGLNVGDWGTCCHPSALYVAFDDGAPIQVGLSITSNDVPQTNGVYAMFVGAFDDSGAFNKVEFWGDGFGEFLYAGGTIRYGLIDEGGLAGVPEPASWALMLAGVGSIGALMRRQRLALTA